MKEEESFGKNPKYTVGYNFMVPVTVNEYKGKIETEITVGGIIEIALDLSEIDINFKKTYMFEVTSPKFPGKMFQFLGQKPQYIRDVDGTKKAYFLLDFTRAMVYDENNKPPITGGFQLHFK